MIRLKTSACILMLGVLLGCAQVSDTNEQEDPSLVNLERDQVLELIGQADPTLALLRNEGTRHLVEQFFIRVTGSRKVAVTILRYSDKLDLSLFLTFSVAFVESSFNPRAVNRNAYSIDRGLFQLNSRSFPRLRERDFFNVEINTRYGLEYLRLCLERGENDITAIALYNAGKTRVVSQGAPLSTLEHINRYVEFRIKLERQFREFFRSVYEDQRLVSYRETSIAP